MFYFPSKEYDYIFGRRNIIFPDGTRKIVFQSNFFGNAIFSEHLERENQVFHAVFTKPLTAKETLDELEISKDDYYRVMSISKDKDLELHFKKNLILFYS